MVSGQPAEIGFRLYFEIPDLAGADKDSVPPTFVLPVGHVSVAGQTVIFSLGNTGTS